MTTILDRLPIADLEEFEQAELNHLISLLKAKTPRNKIRAAFYDGRNAVKDLGMTMPPHVRNIGAALGWSAKAVDILNRRCNLEGFVLPGMTSEEIGLDQIWTENYLDTEAPQAGVSSLLHAVSFLAVTQGDTEADEPDVLVTARSALSGTGLWNKRKRCLDSFLSVIDTDAEGVPTDLILYLPGLNVFCTKGAGRWKVERRRHAYGVPVEPLIYRPRLERPLGASRLTRDVMFLHESALRTMLRSEVQAELFSVPQRILLGADESAFQAADGSMKSTWQALIGRIMALPDLEDEDVPDALRRVDVKEFTAASQEPHIAQLRAWAQLFAGTTSIPLASLGISGEANPTSEGAYDAGRDDLIREAEGTTDGWSPGWRRTALRALQMKNRWDQVPAEFAALRPKWRSPLSESRAAAADAGTKIISQFPWLAETEVGLELFGFDRDFIERAMADKRRSSVGSMIANLPAAVEAARANPAVASLADRREGQAASEDPAGLKQKADALGALIRAGVSAESAAARVGLAGLEFTGAVPVSLRLPEGDAAALEEG